VRDRLAATRGANPYGPRDVMPAGWPPQAPGRTSPGPRYVVVLVISLDTSMPSLYRGLHVGRSAANSPNRLEHRNESCPHPCPRPRLRRAAGHRARRRAIGRTVAGTCHAGDLIMPGALPELRWSRVRAPPAPNCPCSTRALVGQHKPGGGTGNDVGPSMSLRAPVWPGSDPDRSPAELADWVGGTWHIQTADSEAAEPPARGRSCLHPVDADRFVIRATLEREVGVPPIRSLSTTSREAPENICGMGRR
jgi:hypothetical protein